jgi:hypothetical protein
MPSGSITWVHGHLGARRVRRCAIVHAADIQDRDGGVLLMSTLFGLFPFLLKLC